MSLLRRSGLLATLALVLLLSGLGSSLPGLDAPASRAAGRPATVTIRDALAPQRIAPRFLGLSVEMSSIRRLAAYGQRGNLVQLMRSLGPGVLRLGGISADMDTAWVPAGGVRPPWARDVITDEDLAGVAALARRTGWTVILTVNLGRSDPETAAHQVAAARDRLGRYLVGVQIGNEPDNYVTHQKVRSGEWGATAHAAEVTAYRTSIARAVPDVPIAGPDLASWNQLGWLAQFAADVRPALLTSHYYPLPSCTEEPALASLMSPETRSMQTRNLGNLARVAREAGIPLRLTETNSGPCGGASGVSDSPRSALWTVAYLLDVARAGIAGVNVHGGPGRCMSYSPLCTLDDDDFRAGQVTVRPMWYGLLMMQRLVGARFVGSDVVGGAGLVVGTLRSPRGALHAVVVNVRRRAATVRLQAPARYRRGTLLRLQTAVAGASKGVRLGGATVAASGTWRAKTQPRVVRKGGAFRVRVAPGSAVLVTLVPQKR